MAWIESHEGLLTHPKSRRLKRKLNVSIYEVVGILHFFWHWAVKYAEDGDITKFSAEDIADAIEFDGDADKLLQSLIESGFVDERDERRVIHDWFDYGGKLILWRRKEAERLKGYRKSKKNENVHSTNEERTAYEHSTDTVRTPEYSNSNSNSNKDIKHSVDSDECDIAFDRFYNSYPKMGSVRKKAFESFKKLWREKKITPDNIDEVIRSAYSYVSYQKHNGLNTCGAQVFLNQERWNDIWVVTDKTIIVTKEKSRLDEQPDYEAAEPPVLM